MEIPNYISHVWSKFDDFPMETLTKGWQRKQGIVLTQRTVTQMEEDREQYGSTGNCFDLAIWLLDAFNKQRIHAYPIGYNLGNQQAHAAIIAVDEEGKRYLCDLGDQWLKPFCVDRLSDEWTEGLFPAAKIRAKEIGKTILIQYLRPNGKVSEQSFSLDPIEHQVFLGAAEASQQYIKSQPLLECRVVYKQEIAHFEFFNWKSFLSTTEGLFVEEPQVDLRSWVNHLHIKTGFSKRFLQEALHFYQLTGEKEGR